MLNLFVHDWVPASYDNGGGVNALNSPDCRISNSTIQGPPTIDAGIVTDPTPANWVQLTSGVGVKNMELVENCVITGVTQGVWGGGQIAIRGNTIHDICNSYSNGVHENGVYLLQHNSNFYNNVMYNVGEGVTGWLTPGWNHSTGNTHNVYNNLFYNCPQNFVITTETQYVGNTNRVVFANNTLVGTNVTFGQGSWADWGGGLVVANNLCVEDGAGGIVESVHTPNTQVYNNATLTQAQLAANSMTEANLFKPSASVTNVTNAGADLSSVIPSFTFDRENVTRPQGSVWDIGCYELGVPGTLALSGSAYSVDESGWNVLVTAKRTGGSTGTVGISYATANSTATSGSDYTSTSGTLSWGAGVTTDQTFTVPIIDDSSIEADETFTATLSSPTGSATLGSPSVATITIVEDDLAPVNVVLNPSFDMEAFNTSTPSYWQEWSNVNVSYGYTETNPPGVPHSGARDYAQNPSASGTYQFYTWQTITGLEPGLYTAKAWTRSGGGQTQAWLEVKDFDDAGTKFTSVIPTGSTNTQRVISGINVVNGSCTIAFWQKTAASWQWITFDDVELIKQ